MKRLITLAIASSCAFSIITSCASNTEAANTLSASVEDNASLTSEAPEVIETVNKVQETAEAVVTETVETTSEVVVPEIKEKVAEVAKDIVAEVPTEVKEVVAVSAAPQISFNETQINFGTIEQGESFEHDFKFTNTGDAPLLINAAKGSCGCTVPEWPKEQIAPGAEGNIHVKFNSRGKRGNQHKTVTLTTNAEPAQVVLHLNGTVNVPEQK